MKILNTATPLALAVLIGAGSFGLAAPGTVIASPNGETATESDQPITDTWITTKVRTELATTDGVKSTEIGVKTVNGVVTLTGVLASDIAVDKAVAAARSVKGVKQVDASGLKSKA